MRSRKPARRRDSSHREPEISASDRHRAAVAMCNVFGMCTGCGADIATQEPHQLGCDEVGETSG
jgi:hypothetical protein